MARHLKINLINYMKQKKDEKKEDLNDALDEIKQRFGEGAIMKLSGMKAVDIDSIPTGSIVLDSAIGIAGVPRGRIIEVFGAESTGKTTLALHILAEAQKRGGVGAFIDAEHALDPEYAKRIGVKVEDLLISQPDSGEQGLQITETLIRSKAVDVIVIDSVAALTPKTEIEGEIGDQHIGLQARLLSQAMRKLASIVAKTKTLVIFLNQTRVKIGIMFGDPTTTPGGMALKFYASVRIELKRIAQLKHKEQVVGSRIRAKIVKNKIAPPFKVAEFDVYYNEGISKSAEILNKGLDFGIIKKVGYSYFYGKEKIGQGLDDFKVFLKNHPEVEKEVRKAVFG